jgi:hypothetical protein
MPRERSIQSEYTGLNNPLRILLLQVSDAKGVSDGGVPGLPPRAPVQRTPAEYMGRNHGQKRGKQASA